MVPAAPITDDVNLSQVFRVDDRTKNKGTKRGWAAPLCNGRSTESRSDEEPSASYLMPVPIQGSVVTAKRRKKELEFKPPLRHDSRPRDILDILSQPSQQIASQAKTVSCMTVPPRAPDEIGPPRSLSGRDDPRFLSAVDSFRGTKKRIRTPLPVEMDSSFVADVADETRDSVEIDESSPCRPPPLIIPGPTRNNDHANVNCELRPVEDVRILWKKSPLPSPDEECKIFPSFLLENLVTTVKSNFQSGSALTGGKNASKYRSVFKFPYFNLVQSKVFNDVFHTDKSIILCAPTGSGKTAVFELALIRILVDLDVKRTPLQFKAVYMAPMKALCSERYEDWKQKFEPFGVRCLELTGDTEMDELAGLHNINVIITTPEKWDIMTRKWRDNQSLMHKLQLFMVDEIHNLNDDTRGATMEVVISRMKTVDAACRRQEGAFKGIKFVAVSATIPNVDDLAEWLGHENGKAAAYRLDESYRPVKLEKIVLGFPCTERMQGFKFDYSLNYRLAAVIKNYSKRKPTLVFVATRKGTQQAAVILGKDTKFVLDAGHKDRLRRASGLIKEGKLRELMMFGIGYHHAGLDRSDRKLVEDVFIHGDLPVLLATSTLAVGVNLPAHLVIVKCTQYYNMGVYQEYPESQILQMIGRAGRPQFDTSATAVLMTRSATKSKYEQLLNGTEVIESSLHQHLIEHVNAEIVLRTISDVNVALEWIRSTFLYIRCMKNPKHYALPIGLTREEVETYLQKLCLACVKKLRSVHLIEMDPQDVDIKPTALGRHMARFCISYDTMITFMNVKATESLASLIEIISACDQFDISLRVNEKRALNLLNEGKQTVGVRYPLKVKRIQKGEMKVNCLIQAQLGCLKVDDFSLNQDIMRIFRVAVRLARCLVEIMWTKNQFETLLNAVFLAKCLKAKLWENSKFIMRQLEGVGPMMSSAFVNNGFTSFQKLEETNPRDIELIANKKPPFGDNIRSLVIGLPKYRLDISQVGQPGAQSCELQIVVSLSNRDSVSMFRTAGRDHRCCLLVGDSDNNVICQSRLKDDDLLKADWTRKLNVKRAETDDTLHVFYISQDWVGIDIATSFCPEYAAGRTKPIAPVKPLPTSNNKEQKNENGGKNDTSTTPRPCNHRCTNKRNCAHECCKNGITTSRRPATQSKPRNIDVSGVKEDSSCKISQVQEFMQRRMSSNVDAVQMRSKSMASKYSFQQPADKLSWQYTTKMPSIFDNPFDDSFELILNANDSSFSNDGYQSSKTENEYEYGKANVYITNNNNNNDGNNFYGRNWVENETSYCSQMTCKKKDTSLAYGNFDCDLGESPPMELDNSSDDEEGWRSDYCKMPDNVMNDCIDLYGLVEERLSSIEDDSIEWSDVNFKEIECDKEDRYDVDLSYDGRHDDDVIDCDSYGDDEYAFGRELDEVRAMNESDYSSYGGERGGVLPGNNNNEGVDAELGEFGEASPTDELLSKLPLPDEYEKSQQNIVDDSLDDFDIPDHELAAMFQKDLNNTPSMKKSPPKRKNKSYSQCSGRRYSFKKTTDMRSTSDIYKPANVLSVKDIIGASPKSKSIQAARKLFTPNRTKFRGEDSASTTSIYSDKEQIALKPVKDASTRWEGPYGVFKRTSEAVRHKSSAGPSPVAVGPVSLRKKVSFSDRLDYEPTRLAQPRDFKSARSLMTSYDEEKDHDLGVGEMYDLEEDDIGRNEGLEIRYNHTSGIETASNDRSDVSGESNFSGLKLAPKNLIQSTIPARYFQPGRNRSSSDGKEECDNKHYMPPQVPQILKNSFLPQNFAYVCSEPGMLLDGHFRSKQPRYERHLLANRRTTPALASFNDIAVKENVRPQEKTRISMWDKIPVPKNLYQLDQIVSSVNWTRTVLESVGNLVPFQNVDHDWEDCTRWERDMLRGVAKSSSSVKDLDVNYVGNLTEKNEDIAEPTMKLLKNLLNLERGSRKCKSELSLINDAGVGKSTSVGDVNGVERSTNGSNFSDERVSFGRVDGGDVAVANVRKLQVPFMSDVEVNSKVQDDVESDVATANDVVAYVESINNVGMNWKGIGNDFLKESLNADVKDVEENSNDVVSKIDQNENKLLAHGDDSTGSIKDRIQIYQK